MFKELSKEKKERLIEGVVIAASVVLTSFGIGFALGSKYSEVAIGVGLDKCLRDDPELEKRMREAVAKQLVSLQK